MSKFGNCWIPKIIITTVNYFLISISDTFFRYFKNMKCIINWFKNVSNILEQNCDIVKIQNNIIDL